VAGDALAQSSTTGAVRGVIRDRATNEVVIGATVVISGPALQGQQAEITDENGRYVIQNLPPGTYVLTVFYNDAQFDRPNVLIQVGKQAVVNVGINTAEAVGGETIIVEGRAPIIDQGSTKTGPTITSEYTNNIPVGRTFGAVLGAAPGSQGDLYGVSISGSTSVENTYIIEGINTTDTGFGLLSSNLPNEFVQETEVITGGYNAEFGRSTGGVINVVTKSGSNELHGSVFGYFTPGALVAAAEPIARQGSAISTESNLDYRYDFGAEVGGPIVKDKLWFHLGLVPSFSKTTVDRVISARIDDDGDGLPDRDPETQFILVRELDRQGVPADFRTMFFTGKISAAISEDHHVQAAAWGNPLSGTDIYALTGAPSRFQYTLEEGAYDASLKWTSKLADGKTQIDAVGGFHRGFANDIPIGDGDTPRMIYTYARPLSDFQGLNGEMVPSGCTNPDLPFEPCPIQNYSLGGLGFVEERTNDRLSANLAVTQRVQVAGYHTFKAGLEIEGTTYDSQRGYTGGELYEHFRLPGGATRWRRRAFLGVNPGAYNENDPAQIDCLGGSDFHCTGLERTIATTNNRNLGAYLQDSWQIRPNLTINAGLRWEQQVGYTAEEIRGTVSPEGDIVPDIGYQLDNMLAPRLGLIYDPTQEGRAKLFGHWGRFYETVPMDINVRAFGGEVLYLERTSPGNTSCPDPARADMATSPADLADCAYVPQILLGLGTEYVAPGLKGQYIQELIIGGEYELMPDFKLGLNYVHRDLPVVIEDVSTDGGGTYLIANPGENFDAAAADLRRQAEMEADPDRAAVLAYRADLLEAVKTFDKPVRNYDALQVTANQRFSKNALLLASYTYSRSFGNFPGLFSTETGQLDPNLTSMYDLADLMANRYGPLGLDRPHNLKIDGFYQFDLKEAGLVVLGASLRAQSGLAQNTLGRHVFYGNGESYLLPRGAIARSPATWQADVKATYGRRIGKNRLDAFVDVFNLFNNQDEVRVDEIYTFQSVNPVVGGTMEDLRHAKSLESGGLSTPAVNPNFGNTSRRQAPLSVRFGMRFTF
jgi:hypothetical protein